MLKDPLMSQTPWPEAQWEPRTQTLSLDLAAVSRLIAPVFAPRDAISAQQLSGGLANTNYRVRVAGMRETFVLRLYTRDPGACRTEVAIYNLVQDRVPVPGILYADVNGERMGTPYILSEWVEGTPLVDLLATGSDEEVAAAGEHVGATLAGIAAHTCAQPGFFGADLNIAEPLPIGPEGFVALLKDWLFHGPAGRRLGDALLQRLWRFVNANAPLLATIQDACTLVHGDYKASNLLMRQREARWHVAAVLDWEFAFAGPPLFDLAILLRHESKDAPFTYRVASGYVTAGGTLPADWWRITRLLDLLNLVQFLGLPGERERMTRDVTALIVATMETWSS
jgi:aminoglycoside phosphotransferase (APT) family kinase protein